MPPENQSPEDVLAAKKQKMKLVAVIVVFAIVVVMGYSTFFGGESAPPPPPPKMAMGSKHGMPGGATPAGATAAAAMAANNANQQVNSEGLTPKQVSVPENAEIARLQKESEMKYITSLNMLQMLKVERDIAQVNQEILKAELANAKTKKALEQETTVKPTVMSESQYANMLDHGTSQQTGYAPSPAVATSAVNYVVLSVSEQNGKWSAVIGNAGKLYTVSIGDVLISDGSSVVAINHDGVQLSLGGVKRTINITNAL